MVIMKLAASSLSDASLLWIELATCFLDYSDKASGKNEAMLWSTLIAKAGALMTIFSIVGAASFSKAV